MLRALFIGLSESRFLRRIAEHPSLGQKVSGRFVAGLQLEDALRVTQSLNHSGFVVSIDDLGENVTNAEEARASAPAYGTPWNRGDFNSFSLCRLRTSFDRC